jgi:hypothetical protein
MAHLPYVVRFSILLAPSGTSGKTGSVRRYRGARRGAAIPTMGYAECPMQTEPGRVTLRARSERAVDRVAHDDQRCRSITGD